MTLMPVSHGSARIGGVELELISIPMEIRRLGGEELVQLANEWSANSGEEIGVHFLSHQADVPPAWPDWIVFPSWRRPGKSDNLAAYLETNYGRWVRSWLSLDKERYAWQHVRRIHLLRYARGATSK